MTIGYFLKHFWNLYFKKPHSELNVFLARWCWIRPCKLSGEATIADVNGVYQGKYIPDILKNMQIHPTALFLECATPP